MHNGQILWIYQDSVESLKVGGAKLFGMSIFQTFKVLRDFMELFIWSMNQYCVSWIIEDANAWVSGYEIKKKNEQDFNVNE